MREAMEALQKDLKAAQSEIKKRDDEKLTETERIQNRIKELEPLAGTHSKYEQTLQGLYDQELSQIPEAAREKVQTLSSTGDIADRLTALRAAASLVSSATPAAPSTPAQPVINPGAKAGAENTSPEPKKLTTLSEISWSR